MFDSIIVVIPKKTFSWIRRVPVREKNLEFFLKYRPLLEKVKLEGMLREKLRLKEEGKEVELFYFNFTKDGAVQVFELKEPQDYRWGWRYLPKDKFNP